MEGYIIIITTISLFNISSQKPDIEHFNFNQSQLIITNTLMEHTYNKHVLANLPQPPVIYNLLVYDRHFYFLSTLFRHAVNCYK